MAVYYYFKTISGFSGFRVARTVAGKQRQEWLSSGEYGYDLAKSLAYSLDDDWKKEAAAYNKAKKSDRTTYRFSPYPDRPNCIATGLSAYIVFKTEAQTRRGGHELAPCFIVRYPNRGNTVKEFRINKLGYVGAYTAAVDHYADIYGVNEHDKAKLLALMPPASVFTDYLLDRLTERVGVGDAPTRDELEAILYGWGHD